MTHNSIPDRFAMSVVDLPLKEVASAMGDKAIVKLAKSLHKSNPEYASKLRAAMKDIRECHPGHHRSRWGAELGPDPGSVCYSAAQYAAITRHNL
jgi:hypothetical protein